MQTEGTSVLFHYRNHRYVKENTNKEKIGGKIGNKFLILWAIYSDTYVFSGYTQY